MTISFFKYISECLFGNMWEKIFTKGPFYMLAILWFLCTMKIFFDLDMLRLMPGSSNLQSFGRGRKLNTLDQQ